MGILANEEMQVGFNFDGNEFKPEKLKKARTKRKTNEKFSKLDFMAILFPEDYSAEYLEWFHKATAFTWVDDDIHEIARIMFFDAVTQLANYRAAELALKDILAWAFFPDGEPVETDFSFKRVCRNTFAINENIGKGMLLRVIEREVRNPTPNQPSYRMRLFKKVLSLFKNELEDTRIELNSFELNYFLNK